MTTVRAKFTVASILSQPASRAKRDAEGNAITGQFEPCEMRTIKLQPVYGNGDPKHENTKFWQYTPSGSIELGCVNDDASAAFKVGEEFYVDFTPAKK